jgi:hypothetical protein
MKTLFIFEQRRCSDNEVKLTIEGNFSVPDRIQKRCVSDANMKPAPNPAID